MFANFTEETATDSAGVLTLAGATTGMIPFSASFVDGDLVSYAAEDARGNKIAGIGTYNATNNTIMRGDTWNYNGSSVDKNPAANIALSGTVTVRCDVTQHVLFQTPQQTQSKEAPPIIMSGHRLSGWGAAQLTIVANRQYSLPFKLEIPAFINAFYLRIYNATSFSSIKIRAGIAVFTKGIPSSYIAEGEVTISSSPTVIISADIPIPRTPLLPGWYLVNFICDQAVKMEAIPGGEHGWTPYGDTQGSRVSPEPYRFLDVTPGWAALATPDQVQSVVYRSDSPQLTLRSV